MEFRGTISYARLPRPQIPGVNRPKLYFGDRAKRIVVVSNDYDNLDPEFPTLAVVPRTTNGGEVTEQSPVPFGCLFSPEGEANCDEAAFIDCRMMLRVLKSRSLATGFSDVNGWLSEEEPFGNILAEPDRDTRMNELAAALTDSLSDSQAIDGMAPRPRFPRGSLIKVPVNGNRDRLAIVLRPALPTNDHYAHLSTICPLRAPETLPSSHSETFEAALDCARIEDVTGTEYIVHSWLVRTIDLQDRRTRPVYLHGTQPIVFSPDETFRACLAVLAFLGV